MGHSADRKLVVLFATCYVAVSAYVALSSLHSASQDWQKAGNFLTLFWPYVGLALGYGLLLPLISSSTAKLNDQATLAWLQMPVYALHQFEEWGVDLSGKPYAFLDAFNNSLRPILGLPASVPGPLTPIAGLVINTSLVWLAMPLGALLVRNSKYPMATAPGWGVIAVNILPHIVMTVRAGGAYTPGFATAVSLFLPYTLQTAYVMLQQKLWSVTGVAAGLAWGVFGHVMIGVLLTSMIKYHVPSVVALTVFYVVAVALPVLAVVLQPQQQPVAVTRRGLKKLV